MVVLNAPLLYVMSWNNKYGGVRNSPQHSDTEQDSAQPRQDEDLEPKKGGTSVVWIRNLTPSRKWYIAKCTAEQFPTQQTNSYIIYRRTWEAKDASCMESKCWKQKQTSDSVTCHFQRKGGEEVVMTHVVVSNLQKMYCIVMYIYIVITLQNDPYHNRRLCPDCTALIHSV